jgi:hypothetical protein
MKVLLIALVFVVAPTMAQPAIEMPLLGYMQDNQGAWHAVLGTAGNFVLGQVVPEPSAVSATQNGLERRDASIYVIAPNGGTVDILPPEAQTALLLDNGILYSTQHEIVLRRDGASEIRFPAEGVTALRRMSTEYVQASADRQFAIRLEKGREAIFVLPTPPDVAPRRQAVPDTPESERPLRARRP